MTRLTWGVQAERYYETGVDRGVLFVGSEYGVPWNGLISVTESPTGGDAKPAFLDGYKFRNISAAEEYAATIEAFSAPKEFGPCDGTVALQNGLFATQQPRKPFGFTYRTKIGNPIEGSNFGYKIHVVYNALAAPSERTNTTISESGEAASRSWSITTRPPQASTLRPTAHFVIDSRETPPAYLIQAEKVLYGSPEGESRLPSVESFIALFQ